MLGVVVAAAVFSALLVVWCRVHAAVLLHLLLVGGLIVLGASDALVLTALLAPLLYVGTVMLALVRHGLHKPAFELFLVAKRFPLGGLIFDRVALGFVAPHKTVYRPRVRVCTMEEAVVTFDQSYWLQNPFRSVDVGALLGVGEMVAFLASNGILAKRRIRAIPISTSGQFVKKARGRLTVSAKALTDEALDRADGVLTVTSEIRDAAGDLCGTVSTDLKC